DPDEAVLCLADADQLVELGLNRRAVAVLGILDQEHHQEGDDGRPRVDDELPGIAETEQRAARRPQEDDRAARDEGDRLAGCMRHMVGDAGEMLLHSCPVPAGGPELLVELPEPRQERGAEPAGSMEPAAAAGLHPVGKSDRCQAAASMVGSSSTEMT